MSHTMQALSVRRSGAHASASSTWWLSREATLSWLALGLLLSAWNAVDDDAPLKPRPETLRRYQAISVRAMQRAQSEP